MLWPRNGGASSLRRLRWSTPSSANTDPRPKILLRLGRTLIRSSVLARNTCLNKVGSATTTLRPKKGTLMAKTDPWRLAAFRKNRRRNPAGRTPCTGLGRRTTGGCLPGVGGAFASTGAALVIGESLQPVPWYYRVP